MSKGFTNEKFDEFKKIDGFDGPYRNLYLKGIALGKGSKIFDTLEEAIIAANENGIVYVEKVIYLILTQLIDLKVLKLLM